MKKFFVTLILGLLLSTSAFSQTDIFNPPLTFSNDEESVIQKAEKDINRGDKMMTNAQNDYDKYKKLLTSKKKRKQKKGEKKTVSAKRNMLTAATFYNKGYESLYQLYTDRLSNLNFEFDEDREEADKLVADAEKLFQSGQKQLPLNKTYSDKDLKKTVKFTQLKSKVNKGKNDMQRSIEKLVEAMDLFAQQNAKKQKMIEEDNNAWQAALQENTIDAYQHYLDKYPNGLHKTEAQNKIDEIQKQIELAQQQQENPDLVYHVQIMADTHPWTTDEIKRKIYFTNQKIEETYFDGWYKYWIGSFDKYEDAKAFRDQVRKRRKGAFIVATVNGQIVDILKALDVEGSENQ